MLFELNDGQVLSWNQIQDISPSPDKLSRFIHISCRVVALKLIRVDSGHEISTQAEYLLHDGTFKSIDKIQFESIGYEHLYESIRLDLESLKSPLRCVGMLLGSTASRNTSTLLIVKEVLPDISERIGIVSRIPIQALDHFQWSRQTIRLG